MLEHSTVERRTVLLPPQQRNKLRCDLLCQHYHHFTLLRLQGEEESIKVGSDIGVVVKPNLRTRIEILDPYRVKFVVIQQLTGKIIGTTQNQLLNIVATNGANRIYRTKKLDCFPILRLEQEKAMVLLDGRIERNKGVIDR